MTEKLPDDARFPEDWNSPGDIPAHPLGDAEQDRSPEPYDPAHDRAPLPYASGRSPEDYVDEVRGEAVGAPADALAPNVEPAETGPQVESTDPGGNAGDLDSLTVAELRDRARDRGVQVSGSKSELIERLR